MASSPISFSYLIDNFSFFFLFLFSFNGIFTVLFNLYSCFLLTYRHNIDKERIFDG